MKKFFILISLMVLFVFVNAQNQKKIDSLNKVLNKTNDPELQIQILSDLMYEYYLVDLHKSDSIMKQIFEKAEFSRNRELMATAYIIDADRNLSLSGVAKKYTEAAIRSSEKALEIAKSNNLKEKEIDAQITLAKAFRNNNEIDRAIKCNTIALELAREIENDSIIVRCNLGLSRSYLEKNEKVLALRHALEALELTEKIDAKKLSNLKFIMLLSCYQVLSEFYESIKDYEKAKDFTKKQFDITLENKMPNSRLGVYLRLIQLYKNSEQFDLAEKYTYDLIRLADSLKIDETKIKIVAYSSLLDVYMSSRQIDKALKLYEKDKLAHDLLIKAGFEYLDNYMKAFIYSQTKKFDSASYYYSRSEDYFVQRATSTQTYEFLNDYAENFKFLKDYKNQKKYLLKAFDIANKIQNLELMQRSSVLLDSAYQLTGDFKTAYIYRDKAEKYMDSLKLLAKEKDLIQLEIDNENKRKERELKLQNEQRIRRNNIQYMAITIIIAAFFVLLVMFGFFKVSRTTIRVVGFFAFIFLFEFIILLADNKIHHWTHGEPWKVLSIKIVLIAFLLPLHHWIEKKVIDYLTNQNLLLEKGKSFFSKLKLRKKTIV